MRNTSELFKQSIINTFRKENTLAIIIFGIYGTDRQTLESDIDIAWIPKTKVPITETCNQGRSSNNCIKIKKRYQRRLIFL